jgi:hypothetical protein
VRPHETLFRAGDSSEPGIFIVVEGRLGVFLQARGAPAPKGARRAGATAGALDRQRLNPLYIGWR